MAGHAKLSASGAHRWLPCPGSVRLSEGQPDTSNVYSAEGTVAHDVAAQHLQEGRFSVGLDWIDRVVTADGFEITVTDTMLDAVQVYLDAVRDRLPKGAAPVKDYSVELDLTRHLVGLHPDLGGIADCVIYPRKSRVLQVLDYKHGAGTYVDVEDNRQLKYYALGAALAAPDPFDEVVITVVQPRYGGVDPVRSWTFDAFDLLDFQADLVEGARRTYEPDAPLRAGSHCKFCRAAKVCPAEAEHRAALLSSEFSNLTATTIQPERLAEMLAVLPAVEERISQLREYAYQQAAQGNAPPGWKLVPKRATRKWTDAAAVEAVLTDPACWTNKLKTPAQVEKALGKTQYAKLAAPYVTQQSSGFNLVPASDKRAPAKLVSPDEFNVVE